MRLSQSFKVFYLQEPTLKGLRLIEEIGGETDRSHPCLPDH
jgi:hypothetical protein